MPLFLLFNTQTMHIKSFYTQQHCYVFLKNLIPWRDSNPGLLVPEADTMSTAPRRQGNLICYCMYIYIYRRVWSACSQSKIRSWAILSNIFELLFIKTTQSSYIF
jgi:hypothetical protein